MHAKDILIDGYNRIQEEVHAAVEGPTTTACTPAPPPTPTRSPG